MSWWDIFKTTSQRCDRNAIVSCTYDTRMSRITHVYAPVSRRASSHPLRELVYLLDGDVSFVPREVVVLGEEQHAVALLALAHRDARAVPEPTLHLRLLVVVVPAWAQGRAQRVLVLRQTLITTAVTDLSMQKYVSLPLAYCSENLRITSRFFAEAECANAREGTRGSVTTGRRSRRARGAKRKRRAGHVDRRTGRATVSERVTSRRALGAPRGSRSGRRRDAGTRFARSGGGVMRTIRVDAQGGAPGGRDGRPRAVARIALPRSSADEPRRAAPATAKVDVTADMSCERVGRVRWRFAFGCGTTEVVARCVVTRVVNREAAVSGFVILRPV